MLFQPPSGPPDPWNMAEYFVGLPATMFWIVGVLSLILGFFAIVDYIKNRKEHHLAFGVALLLIWTILHQLNNYGNYEFLYVDPIILAGTSLILGLVAAGLIYNTFSEQKLIGHVWLLFVIVMTVAIAMTAQDLGNQQDLKPYIGAAIEVDCDVFESTAFMPVLAPIVNLVLTIPSLAIMVIVPLYTTFIKKDTKLVALFMPIGAILLGINVYYVNIFLLMTGTYQVNYWMDVLWVIFSMYQFFLAFGVACIAFGMLTPKKWSFAFPGVEFEER